jgi:hypothetical protein
MNFGHRRGLELVELAATPETKKVLRRRSWWKPGRGQNGSLRASSALWAARLDQGEVWGFCPGRPRGPCAEDGAQTSRIAPGVRGTRLATHPRLARSMACPRLGRRGGGAEKGLSGRIGSNGRGVAGNQGASLAVREISYIKGNLRSGLSFYFKSGLSGLV